MQTVKMREPPVTTTDEFSIVWIFMVV